MKNTLLRYRFKDYSGYDSEHLYSAEKLLEQNKENEKNVITNEQLKYIMKNVKEIFNYKYNSFNINYNDNGFKNTHKLFEINESPFNPDDWWITTAGLVGAIEINGIEVPSKHEETSDENYGGGYENNKYDIQITISTRFDEDKDNKHLYFLCKMLSCGDLEFNEFAPETEVDNLFNILLIHLLKMQLKMAYNQGIYKAYQNFKRNDSKIKGSIDFARHIKDNIMFTGRIAYNTRENTYDNETNYLILYAYEYLKKKYPSSVQAILLNDNQTRKIITELKELTPGRYNNDVKKVISKCMRPISHPYYQKSEMVRKTCIRILQNMGLSIFNGTKEEVCGLLYYVPDLWENFLINSYYKYNDSNIKVDKQRNYYIFSASQGNQQINDGDGKEFTKNIRPDFVFSKEDKEVFILDAKFKPRWYDSAKKSMIHGSIYNDYLQVINYMVTANIKAAGVIFPTNKSKLEGNEHKISKENDQNRFYCFDVNIPQITEDNMYRPYMEWSKEFDEQLKTCIKEINAVIIKNY